MCTHLSNSSTSGMGSNSAEGSLGTTAELVLGIDASSGLSCRLGDKCSEPDCSLLPGSLQQSTPKTTLLTQFTTITLQLLSNFRTEKITFNVTHFPFEGPEQPTCKLRLCSEHEQNNRKEHFIQLCLPGVQTLSQCETLMWANLHQLCQTAMLTFRWNKTSWYHSWFKRWWMQQVKACHIHCVSKTGHPFWQRNSIACYAERCLSYDRFCLTVCLTVRHSPVSYQNDSSYDHAVFTGG